MKLDPLQYAPRLKVLRETHGLLEAKRMLDREYLLNAIGEARTFYELRQVMRAVAEKIL